MQDRYVGDIGDFAKYALLRSINTTPLNLGVVWCLYPNENHNADGRHVRYLEKLEFRHLDPILHDELSRILKGRRSIDAVQRSPILSSKTVCFDELIAAQNSEEGHTTRLAYRRKWLSNAFSFTSRCDVVFFDPDNGLETPSVAMHHPRAGKYIFFEELRPFWERGQSLVIYHHLNRTMSVRAQTLILKRRLLKNFAGAGLLASILFRRGSCRHFWIVSHKSHKKTFEGRIEAMMSSGWKAYFELG